MPDAGSAYLNRPARKLLDGSPAPLGGIYARTLLPSPTYDHMFRLTRGPQGECRCRFKIGCGNHDWWEDVPAPEGWSP